MSANGINFKVAALHYFLFKFPHVCRRPNLITELLEQIRDPHNAPTEFRANELRIFFSVLVLSNSLSKFHLHENHLREAGSTEAYPVWTLGGPGNFREEALVEYAKPCSALSVLRDFLHASEHDGALISVGADKRFFERAFNPVPLGNFPPRKKDSEKTNEAGNCRNPAGPVGSRHTKNVAGVHPEQAVNLVFHPSHFRYECGAIFA